MKILVLGTGCPSCKILEKNVTKIVSELKIKAEVKKITEIDKIISYGVMSLPALIIDDELKCSGTIPSDQEIKKWLQQKEPVK